MSCKRNTNIILSLPIHNITVGGFKHKKKTFNLNEIWDINFIWYRHHSYNKLIILRILLSAECCKIDSPWADKIRVRLSLIDLDLLSLIGNHIWWYHVDEMKVNYFGFSVSAAVFHRNQIIWFLHLELPGRLKNLSVKKCC